MATSKVGLPYGTYPRLIMAQVTKQAVLKRSPCIELSDSLSAYMSDLGLSATGGRWGSIARLREHLARLLTCSISCTSEQTAMAVPGQDKHFKADVVIPPRSLRLRDVLAHT